MNAPKGEETIFAEALRLPPEERAAYLAQSTHGNAELRQRIESLLGSYEAGDFLEQAAAPQARPTLHVTVPLTEKAGDRIGRYKLLQQIGEGGCGVVYVAEQAEPVRRRVALKIIKLGMDTKSVIARFEAERQAVAMMDHPNIAKIFDAGSTERPLTRPSDTLSPAGGEGRGEGDTALSAGRPYFVMELVRGMKITEYCDEAKLSTRARLDLFIQVCQAIQHAHQKGIIHRDIKPSNILVTVNDGVPVPKVIDFGIAKATNGQQLTDKTLFTAFEQFIGTPAYMSPEQAVLTSLDIDTRSDIYALGVLLYELLTGKTPFDAKELLAIGLDEMRRTIREQEPPRPSTRLSTLPGQELNTTAQRRGLDAPKLVSELRGDLDWIVMKALEKDRARRYETANGLAMDLQRHLNNEPVVARPPSAAYRFGKLVRRNKLAFVAGASVAAALVLGLGVATWMFFRERTAKQEQVRLRQTAQAAQRNEAALRLEADTARTNEARLRLQAQAGEKKAEAEAARSEQVVQFLKEMLKGLGPSVAWGGDRTLLQEMLKQTAARIGQGLTNQPDVAISLRLSLAETYEELGLYEPEAEIAEQALLFAQSTIGKESLPAANSLAQLGWAEWRLNRLDQAEKHSREGLAMRRKLLGNEHALVADSLGKLCFVLANQKKPVESETAAREALTLRQKLLGDDHPDVARSLAALATVLRMAGRYDEAEPYAREALTLHRKLLGNGHYDTTTALNKLAMVLMGQRKFAEAEDLMRESLATQKKLLGDKHPELVLSLNLLGQILSARKQAEAEAMHREAMALQRKLHGDEHPAVAQALNNLAVVLRDQGKLAEAETMHREALTMRRKLLGDEHPEVARSLDRLAVVLSRQGKQVEAETMQREALALRRKLHGDEHPDVAVSLNNLAMVLVRQGKLAEAETMHREALTMWKKLLGDEHPDVALSLNNLADALFRQSKLAEAEVMYREELALQRKLHGDEHPDVAQSLNKLARVLFDQGKLAEAEDSLRQALATARKAPETPALGKFLHHLAEVLRERKNLGEARSLAEEAVALYQRHADWPSDETAHAFRVLMAVLTDARDFERVDALWPQQVQFVQAQWPADDPELAGLLAEFALGLLSREKFGEAEPLARECLAIREKKAPDDWRTFNSRSVLGGSLLGQKKYAEAEPLLLSGYEGMMQRENKIPPIGRSRLRETHQRLVQLYEATGRLEDAAKWKQKLAEFEEKEEQRRTAITRETQSRDSSSKTNSPPK